MPGQGAFRDFFGLSDSTKPVGSARRSFRLMAADPHDSARSIASLACSLCNCAASLNVLALARKLFFSLAFEGAVGILVAAD